MEEVLKEVRKLDNLSTNFVVVSLIILCVGIAIIIIWAKLNTENTVVDFVSLTLFISSIIVSITGLIMSCKLMHDARELYDNTLYEYIEEKDYTLYINGVERDTDKMNIRQIKFSWNKTEVNDEEKEIYITRNSDWREFNYEKEDLYY